MDMIRILFTNDDVSLNQLEFNSPSPDNYSIGGGGSVNLEADSSGVRTSMHVLQGDHQFQARVNLLNDANLDVAL